MASPYDLSTITSGLFPDSTGTQTSLITSGLQPMLWNTPLPPNTIETNSSTFSLDNLSTSQYGTLGLIGGIDNGSGTSVTSGSSSAVGSNSTSLPSFINGPAVNAFDPFGTFSSNIPLTTYTGTDLTVLIDLVDTPTVANTPSLSGTQLIQCTTISVSIHREKAAVRAAGYIGAKGFARGKRTIAGSIVLTQFTLDSLYSFLMAQQISGHDLSKDTTYVKPDQLPPFNMTLLFADELGNVSYRRILGVDFVTDGVVYSTNDMVSEQVLSYVASDMTPLLSIKDSALFTPDKLSNIYAAERTVQTVLNGNTNNPAIPSTNLFGPN